MGEGDVAQVLAKYQHDVKIIGRNRLESHGDVTFRKTRQTVYKPTTAVQHNAIDNSVLNTSISTLHGENHGTPSANKHKARRASCQEFHVSPWFHRDWCTTALTTFSNHGARELCPSPPQKKESYAGMFTAHQDAILGRTTTPLASSEASRIP